MKHSKNKYFEQALMLFVLLLCIAAGFFPDQVKRVEAKPLDGHNTVPTPDPIAPQGDRAGFSLIVKEIVTPFRIATALVNPGEEVQLRTLEGPPGATYTAEANQGAVMPTGPDSWTWLAPRQPGSYSILVRDGISSSILLNALVLTPFAPRQRSIDGYAIGGYPLRPFKNNPIYTSPSGFVQVTAENRDILVSPNFTLGQFLCKQPGDFPKYLLLSERLIVKLELILEEMNRRGYSAETFHVMSGYRTPAYNRSLKNVQYSMHQWGYAADVFVDQNPKDGVMDDLNGDGRINQKDARVITSIVEEMDRDARFQAYLGGLGGYGKTRAHGPFVHVDVRGWDARWGVGVQARDRVNRVALSD